MTECIKCKNLDLKANEQMSKVGFSRCKKKPAYEFVSIKRDIQCDDYRKDKPEVIEKRIEWRNKREGGRK
jgi:hypothetical protein